MKPVARGATVAAQAKLNLFLRVLAREAGGYHQLETLFCRLTLADTVSVEPTGGPRTLDVTGRAPRLDQVGPVERNLAWRAAAAYADATGFPAGFSIRVEKRIPVGGGLGGGSADAGAVLRALNALNPAPLDGTRILRLAADLGADVPFLTQDRTPLALGWGRGEQLLLLPPLPARAVWLVIPAVGVDTADAYHWFDQSAAPPEPRALTISGLSDWASVASAAHNDLEAPVAARVRVIGGLLSALRVPEVRELLGPGGTVLMSGSGSTVAVLAGTRPDRHLGPPPPLDGVTIAESETATFVEPVVLTH